MISKLLYLCVIQSSFLPPMTPISPLHQHRENIHKLQDQAEAREFPGSLMQSSKNGSIALDRLELPSYKRRRDKYFEAKCGAINPILVLG